MARTNAVQDPLKAVHLAKTLEDEVLQVLADQLLIKIQDIEQLVKALQQSLDQQEHEQAGKV